MSGQPSRSKNHLLAALPAEDLARISPRLVLVDMPLGKVLYESGG
ncbi:Crp/Fnr family transcriptional regulator, partial [Burkholderia pyrrocinia]